MRPSIPAPAVAAGLLGLAAIVTLLTASDVGTAIAPPLADPGALVRWSIPVVRVLVDLAMATAIGAVALAFVIDSAEPYRPALILAGRACAVWSGAQAVLLIAVSARAAGLAPTDVGLWPVATNLISDTAGGFGAAITALAAGVAAVALAIVGRGGAPWSAYPAAALVLVAALASAPAGHASSSAAGSSVLIGRAMHLLGVGAWVGGLLALVVLWPGLWSERRAVAAAQGYSVMAGAAFFLVAGSGVATGLAVIGRVDLFGSAYSRLLVAKTVLLLVLGAMGAWHRARHVPRLDRAGARGLLRLALAELAVMAVVFAFAAVLADTPTPQPLH